MNKYAPHSVPSPFKLKGVFYNSKLDSDEKDPDEWISNFAWLQIWMNEFGTKDNMRDKVFMIHIVDNLPEENHVTLDGSENLTLTGPDASTIDVIHDKLILQKIKTNAKKKIEEKVLAACSKQFNCRCYRCRKIGHRWKDTKCSENKN